MITDEWDIAHIAIAVSDLERSMAEYSVSLGVEWGPVEEMPDAINKSEVFGAGIGTRGVRSVQSRNTGETALQLYHAPESSPGYVLYGCPDGRDYVHHTAYWIDENKFEAEFQHLRDHGFKCEMEVGEEWGFPVRVAGYFKSPTGIRIEILHRSIEERLGRTPKAKPPAA
jgi:catechol 2,3-dioxygenase-like lactoylglutathione lyase family enzyme